ASFYYPVRLQLNGQFYQLANHNDVQTEELLDRLGFDRNGALYNAAGTIQPSQFSTGGFEKKTRRVGGGGTRITCTWPMRSPNLFRLPHGGQMSSRCWTCQT